MDVEKWLNDLGLSQYTEAFLNNDIDAELLFELEDAELEKLGIRSLGHRKRILKAIGAQKGVIAEPVLAASAPTASHEPERRHLTVMFCDMVGSSGLAEQLDPEDVREMIRAYQDACAGVVSRFEGYVAKYIGDGILIYFGYPKAHEDDAERALRSALGIVAAVGAIRKKDREVLAVRIGIATGLVVVGDIVGEGASQEKAVIGETPNLAARLQNTAGPNDIVISGPTRDLAGGQFVYHDLGPQTLKGISKPTNAWKVLGERTVETRFQARSARVKTTIGRDQESELLLERWRRVAAGEGQLVMLSGEAGIGKSHITEALQRQIKNDKRWSIRYQCSPHHVNSPLYPAIQQLQFAAAIERDDSNEVKLAKVEKLLHQSNAISHLQFVSALLSIDTRSRFEPLSPLEQKQRILQALISLFEGPTAHQPILFVLEDAHWIDPTTRELLDILADRVSSLRAMILVTHRPEFNAPWASYPHCTSLALGRLSRTACLSLINDLTAGRKLPPQVLDQIILKADGIPLFLEELTKTVLESDLLVERNGSYELDGPLPPLAIPSTLQDSLMARLDRLEGAKEIAQIGAAIGREFSHRLLEAVSPIKGAALNTALEMLRHSEIIFRRGVPPDAIYVFKHALIQDTAYDTLLRSRRQQIHARLAQVMKAAGDVEPELIAHHFTSAGLTSEAAPEWLRAGQQAVARSANIEAIAHLTRGLEMVHNLPASAATRSIELDMQISLGSAQIAARGYSATETEQAYARARELLPETGDDARTFAILHGLAMVYWNKAQLGEMNGVANDMLMRANRSKDRVPTLVAHRVMSVFLNTTGRFQQASEHGALAVSLYDGEQDHETAHVFGHDQGVGALCHLAIAQTFLGDVAEATISKTKAGALARSLNNANTLLYDALWSSFISVVTHHWTQAHEITTAMVSEAEKRSMALWAVFGRHFLGCTLVGLGSPEAGLAELERSRSDASKLENRIFLPMTLSFEAQARASLGQRDEAVVRLSQALQIIRETQERWWEPEVYRLHGEIVLANGGAPTECRKMFERAVEIATSQNATLLVERAKASLCVQA